MLKHIRLFFFCIFFLFFTKITNAEITIHDLIFSEDKPFHLKLLEALPTNAKIEYGPINAKNTIVEFMDYYCFYCKKINPELVELVNERDDLRVVFIQYPIINENSMIFSKMVIAANFQKKGFNFHHNIFSINGSITQTKLEEALKKSGVNQLQLKIDLGKEEVDQIIQLSSFIAGGIGVRGTPAIFINEEFTPGYISKAQIKGMLN